jgi:Ca2+-binding RTX toxin-like protein
MRRVATVLIGLVVVATVLIAESTTAQAGTNQISRDLVCSFGAGVTTNRVATVTVTAPDEVTAGSVFDVDFLVEIDLPAVSPLSIFDFSVRSQWTINGGATPSGSLTIETAGQDYPLGATIVYETVTQSFTATGSAGDSISYVFDDVDYLFAFSTGGSVVTADCVFAGPPVDLGSTLITPAAETCDGQPVTITGTAGSDVIVGTAGSDVIAAGAGNDIVLSLSGADTVCGGDGNDVVFGGAGPDSLDGGGGFNILVGGAGSDTCTNGVAILC